MKTKQLELEDQKRSNFENEEVDDHGSLASPWRGSVVSIALDTLTW